jgi:hypothetical protein
MPNSGKKHGDASRTRTAKLYWLPMPRREADTVILQCRLAMEAIRYGRASDADAGCILHAVMLTGMLTELGYGKLDQNTIGAARDDLLDMFDVAAADRRWEFSKECLKRLIDVVNEHDRQLRETRLEALIACDERLRGFIASVWDQRADPFQ